MFDTTAWFALDYLSGLEAALCAPVCKDMAAVVSSDRFWRGFVERAGVTREEAVSACEGAGAPPPKRLRGQLSNFLWKGFFVHVLRRGAVRVPERISVSAGELAIMLNSARAQQQHRHNLDRADSGGATDVLLVGIRLDGSPLPLRFQNKQWLLRLLGGPDCIQCMATLQVCSRHSLSTYSVDRNHSQRCGVCSAPGGGRPISERAKRCATANTRPCGVRTCRQSRRRRTARPPAAPALTAARCACTRSSPRSPPRRQVRVSGKPPLALLPTGVTPSAFRFLHTLRPPAS
jgi:hypothetical protein